MGMQDEKEGKMNKGTKCTERGWGQNENTVNEAGLLPQDTILAIANTKETPGCYDPARFQVHCGIGRWQHCFRFGGCACRKCAFPAARRPGYYSASVRGYRR